ncbi:cysteine desulfurase family protein [Candidatus Kuenenia stuttgartiensis]|uniref:cysteine desulfurase family protein n=1 Tax=Kuenenia stuttgartiensis TaxID=174633 RepID=UPI0021BCEB60|nr:cysteine desulfurase family protein [Candidatus Kuenenia stuttgartiensis]
MWPLQTGILKNHIITTTIEHPSVINTCEWLERHGFMVTYLKIDKTGKLNPEDLKSAITEKTCLISVMMANNETGSINPIAALVRIAKERNVLFHSDCVQAVGKIPIDVEALGVDLLTMSGHKLYGPKGVGALYISKGIVLEPLVNGGKQESGMRAGTENVLGIVGLGKAAELAVRRIHEMDRIKRMRDRLEAGIRELMAEAKMNGNPEALLPNTLNMTLPGIRGESVVLALDQKGISLSSGSACRAGSPKPSHALLAMGLTEEEAHCALRFSLGFGNMMEEIDRTITLLGEVIRDKKTMVRFVPCR